MENAEERRKREVREAEDLAALRSRQAARFAAAFDAVAAIEYSNPTPSAGCDYSANHNTDTSCF